mmetsp:Transcript_109075/g.243604  ORF Transcript_109075/g.243604 Transcript_109075/m.243604 type:complete len:263 (-) Transcript_109075:8-796(-)
MVEGLLLPLVCIIAELDCCVHDVLEVLGPTTHRWLNTDHVVVPIAVVVVAREPAVTLRAPFTTHQRVGGVSNLIAPVVLGQRGLLRKDFLEFWLGQLAQDFGELLSVRTPQCVLQLLQISGLGSLLVLQGTDEGLQVLVKHSILQGLKEPWLVLGDARQQGCCIHARIGCILRAWLRRWKTCTIQFRCEGLYFATLGGIDVDGRILPLFVRFVLAAVNGSGLPTRVDHRLPSISPAPTADLHRHCRDPGWPCKRKSRLEPMA